MSLFGWFRNHKVPNAVHDSVLGTITYSDGAWVSTEEYMVIVVAPESGPTQIQRDFFENIRTHLPGFERRACAYIGSLGDSNADTAQLSVYSVEIGSEDDCRRERFVLELSDVEANYIHRVGFAGEDVVEYAVDD